MLIKYDYVIVGVGIIGLAIAREIRSSFPDKSILLIDKESCEAFHASGRNSGVLHSGFYYQAKTLKAKFTVEGNQLMREYCINNKIAMNNCGKVVIAQDESELQVLGELLKRGEANGSNVKLIDCKEVEAIDSNIKTYQKALFSPDTASVNPKDVCQRLKKDLEHQGVHFSFETKYLSQKKGEVITNKGVFIARKFINCAGLYADKIAKDFGFGKAYTIIPFKGLYLKYTKNTTDIKTNVYPVPNLKYPFLGVHFTKTVNDEIKIGPTAIPAFWRENYRGLDNFNVKEFASIVWEESKLFFQNTSNFRDLAVEEIKKYQKSYFINLAQKMVYDIDPKGFTEFTQPGIRAQLLHKSRKVLVQDFLIEGDSRSVHILNAVSPAFTCAFPFARYIVKNYI